MCMILYLFNFNNSIHKKSILRYYSKFLISLDTIQSVRPEQAVAPSRETNNLFEHFRVFHSYASTRSARTEAQPDHFEQS